MGLRTASVRHPHVMVMAPALTKSTQSPNFKLPHLNGPTVPSTTPISNRNEYNLYNSFGEGTCEKPVPDFDVTDLENANDNLNTLALVSEIVNNKNFSNTCLVVEEHNPSGIMNNSPLHMGDQKDKMGLQKAGLDVVSLIKDKTLNSEVDQLFNNIESVLPSTDTGSGSEMGQNVDDLMQVIKCIESGSDRLGVTTGDLGAEADNMFPLSLEKVLFNDVDVMNMSMEEQLLDGTNTLKENHTKELISDLQKKHTKLERRLEFLLRRLRKMQAKYMGQHISEEIAGVFEHVHRTLRRAKDNNITMQSHSETSCVETTLEKLKPISQASARNLVRKLEMSTNIQANAAGRQRHTSHYFGSGSIEPSSVRSALVGATIIPQWTSECKHELKKTTGLLHTETRLLQEQLDSDATLSSSGGESCDEMQTYNNPHQQYLTIQKRAAWKYATERAAIAARWTWLQAQIADLEYRIRQYSELHKQIRANKGSIVLGGASPPHSVPSSPSAVNGYRGLLPGASPIAMKSFDSTANGSLSNSDPQIFTSARTRPVINFRKRKLLQTWGLHVVSKKAARPSTIRCGCTPPSLQCALCTGRTDPTHPRDLIDYLSKSERISLLDPSFHPVFSLPEDASANIHFEAIMKAPEWKHRSTRPNMKMMKFFKGDRPEKHSVTLDHQPKRHTPDHRRKYNRILKSSTINALTAKIKSKFRGRKPSLHSLARLRRKRHSEKLAMSNLSSSIGESGNEDFDTTTSAVNNKIDSRSSSPLLSIQTIPSYKRSRVSSYDIDNIVIPYSVAAATRVEKLEYKEILTPKWRIVDPDFTTKCNLKNNSVVDTSGMDSDGEDFSEEAVAMRHEKCEHDEKKKFLSYLKFPYGYGRSRSNKRTDSRAESSGCNTPDPMSPHTGEILENAISPLTSPPATPLSIITEDSSSLPTMSMFRRRTISQSRGKDRETIKDDFRCSTPEVEIFPYDRREFPLTDDTYDKMLKLMPENYQFKTNIRAQDYANTVNYLDDDNADSPESESTESALGDEDPNDPEWIDMENIKDRYRR